MLDFQFLKDEMKNKMPVASVLTPFDKNGDIDYEGLCNYVDFIVEAGTSIVLLTYGDSLFSILTCEEIYKVTKAVVAHTKKRAIVVAATGMWWTQECVRFAEFARESGADILMTLPPNWAGSVNDQTLINHYTEISKLMPVMIVTALGSKPVPLPVLKTLLEEKNNVIAIKDDVCGSYGRKMASLVGKRWAVLSGGTKENHLDLLPYGVDSYLSVFMSFKPEVSKLYWEAVQKGDIKTSVEVIRKYEWPYINELAAKTGLDLDAQIHATMEICGICQRYRRNPYINAGDEQMDIIRGFLYDIGLWKGGN